MNEVLHRYFYALDAEQRQAFARGCRTSQGYITQMANGTRKIQPHTAMLMEITSGGQMRAEDLSPKAPWQRWFDFRASTAGAPHGRSAALASG
jgi:DNA-binding transcriptional regulator YdaS (Cro superfamily)